MLYFLYGDFQKSNSKAEQLVQTMLDKKPDATFFKINSENFDESELDFLLGGQGLFTQKYIVKISNILDHTEYGDLLLKKVKDLSNSENIFIWVEGEIKKAELKKIEKYAEKVQETSPELAKQKNKFNIFSLTDVLGRRDRKQMWFKYQEALKHVSVDEIINILIWQAKTMLVANNSQSADSSGLKAFSYNKAKGFNRNYESNEILELYFGLLEINHFERVLGQDKELALEKFLLNI